MGYGRIFGRGLAHGTNAGIKFLEDITYKTDNWIALKPKAERDKIKRKNEIIKERTKAKRQRERQEHINKIILANDDDEEEEEDSVTWVVNIGEDIDFTKLE